MKNIRQMILTLLRGNIVLVVSIIFVLTIIGISVKSDKISTQRPAVEEEVSPLIKAAPVNPVDLEADKGRLTELKKEFNYSYDEFEDKGWYSNKSQEVGVIYNKKLLRAYVNNKGYIYLESQYYGDDWLFHTRVEVKIGDIVYKTEDVPTYDESNVTNNASGSIWEHVSYLAGRDNGIIKAIAESGDTPIKVRFVGRQSNFDITLAERDRQAIKDAYELSQLIKRLGTNN